MLENVEKYENVEFNLITAIFDKKFVIGNSILFFPGEWRRRQYEICIADGI